MIMLSTWAVIIAMFLSESLSINKEVESEEQAEPIFN